MLQKTKSLLAKRGFRWFRDLMLLLLLVYAVEYWQSRHLTKGLLPEFLRLESLPTLEAHTRSLWSPDHYTVLYVFAPWCGVCRGSAANMNSLPKDRFHVVSLALSWGQASEVEEFVKSTGLKTPILMGKEREEAALGIESFPSYLVIDREGRIVKAWSGYTTTLGLFFKGYWAQL